MAKLKMLKAPRKPKRSASLATKEKYIAKVNAIKKENQSRHAINQRSEKMDKVIAGIGSVSVRPSAFKSISVRGTKRRKKKVAAPAKRRKKRAISGVPKRKIKKHTTTKKRKTRRW